MKISIIVTAHENPIYLDNTLFSIKKYVGLDDYEVIVVDNSKSNELFKVYTKYITGMQSHISYVKVQGNSINDLRNAGLQLASGEYILFLMAGDELLRDFIHNATGRMDAYGFGMYITAYYNSDGEYECSSFLDMRIGPILCLSVLRRSSIPVDFHWPACGDNIMTGIMLNNGASYYHDKKNIGVIYKQEAYNWMNDEGTEYLKSINIDWQDYVYMMAGETIPNIDVSVHVTNRCNKDCVACGHFAPLVPKDDPNLTPEQFRIYMNSLYKYQDIVKKLILTGGEPTINPNCMEIVRIAREYFHDVRLVSNGLNPEFFKENAKELQDLNVEVYITNYNKDVVKTINSYLPCGGYTIPALENDQDERIYFWSGMLTNKEQTEYPDLIGNCGRFCSQLVGTRLYLCQYTANFKYFDNFFKGQHQLPDVEDSYINLTTTNLTNLGVKNFIYNHICEMCKHCKEHYMHNGLEGDVCDKVELCHSKQAIEEWVR